MYRDYILYKRSAMYWCVSQIPLKMKLFLALFFCIILQASAKNMYAQNISIKVKNASLKSVINIITEQSNYEFAYNDALLQKSNLVTVNLTDQSIEKVLNVCFKDQPLNYVIKNNTIVITDKIAEKVIINKEVIAGKVISKDTETPIPGVTVKIKGKSGGTVTDVNGLFKMDADVGEVLQFSSVGYTSQEFTITNLSFVNVTMAQSVTSLNDIVVIGYGTQKKGDLSGSVVSVKTKDLNTVNAVSVDNLLQGRVAGLNVQTYTAQPGGGIEINIRGSISPLGGSTPLYVIDGVQITNNTSTDFTASGGTAMRGFVDRNPLNNINPNDIETITVLKDASATAIYGSSAANGVILITTKKGAEGKVSVSYDASYAIQKMAPYIEMFNAQDFMINANRFGAERRLFDNNYAPFYGKKIDNGINPYVPKFSDDEIAAAGKGFNWIDHITRDGAISNHNVSISGGNKSTKIYSSLNYFDQ